MTATQSDLRPDWLDREQFPFAAQAVDLPSGRLTYVDEGEGPILLFVHAGMWSFIFRDVISRLRSDFRCIAMDFPGYGLNQETDREYEIRDMSELLAEFIRAQRLNDVTVVAHDLGGVVALGAAAVHADRIAGMVLANTFAWTPDTAGLRTMFRVMSSRVMTGLDTATNLVPRLTATSFGVGRHLDRPGRRTFLAPYHHRDVRRRFHLAMRSAFRDPGFTDSIADAVTSTLNDRPVLTIFGEKNDPFGFQARHALTFPDHEGIIVEAGNHFPMMDDPDLFASAVRSWHGRRVVSRATS
jgi:haloalkane dehalogenase